MYTLVFLGLAVAGVGEEMTVTVTTQGMDEQHAQAAREKSGSFEDSLSGSMLYKPCLAATDEISIDVVHVAARDQTHAIANLSPKVPFKAFTSPLGTIEVGLQCQLGLAQVLYQTWQLDDLVVQTNHPGGAILWGFAPGFLRYGPYSVAGVVEGDTVFVVDAVGPSGLLFGLGRPAVRPDGHGNAASLAIDLLGNQLKPWPTDSAKAESNDIDGEDDSDGGTPGRVSVPSFDEYMKRGRR